MFNAGMVRPGSTVYIPINTFDSNDPSASVTATDWANTDCHIHKDGGTTQRASSSGETLSINFDTVTGNHLLAIDTADNDTANFYEAGSTYHVRIEGVTVDSGTINAWIGCFSIGYEAAIVNTTIATLASQTSFTLEDGSADDDVYNDSVVVVHDLASAVQIAQGIISDYTGSTKTVTLAADPGIFTMAAGDNISIFPKTNVATIKGNSQTAGDLAALITTVDTVVDAIKAVTDNLPDSGALSTIDTNIDDIESRLGTPSDFGSGTSTIAANLEDMADNGTASYDRSTDSLQAIRDHIGDGTNLTEAGGDGDHLTEAGATGDHLTAVPWNAAWDTEVQSEVEDAITAARSEPTGVPAANESLVDKINYLFMALRNRIDVTSTKKTFYDDGGAGEWEKDLSDDGTTYSESEGNAI